MFGAPLATKREPVGHSQKTYTFSTKSSFYSRNNFRLILPRNRRRSLCPPTQAENVELKQKLFQGPSHQRPIGKREFRTLNKTQPPNARREKLAGEYLGIHYPERATYLFNFSPIIYCAGPVSQVLELFSRNFREGEGVGGFKDLRNRSGAIVKAR